jgi:cytochrome c553
VAAGDARAIRLLLQASISGAIPGARNAKAQYQNVLSAADLEDLAAYLARVQSAAAASPLARN